VSVIRLPWQAAPATTLAGLQRSQADGVLRLFPIDADQYGDLRDALEKLKLNDAALHYEPETSSAMGFGFRCGFLGLLHMEIVQERLEREYNLDFITTAPSVVYQVTTIKGEVFEIDNPSTLPSARNGKKLKNPMSR
jgi:GTP-binding protein LepA